MSRLTTVLSVPALLIGLALLAGCSILPKPVSVQIWQPPTDNAVVTTRIPQPFSLRIATPHASGLIDDSGIVVMPTNAKVSTYAGARWDRPAPVLVRSRLVDAFMQAGLSKVSTDADNVAADYTLGGNLRAYQVQYTSGAPVVVVRYDAQLRRHGSRHVLAAHSFTVRQTPHGSTVADVVNAFGGAGDQLAQQVTGWVLNVVAQQPAKPEHVGIPAPEGQAAGPTHR